MTPAPMDGLAPVTGGLAENRWLLELYVAGKTRKSGLALQNLTAICEEHLKGRYSIEVIDLALDPGRAVSGQIIAIPTLIRRWPEPVLAVVGDLSGTAKALVGLGLSKVAA